MQYILPAAIGAGASLIGGMMGREHQENQYERNVALQREFAQNSIKWKTEDAKRSGIHPLYALGAPSISPAVSIAGDPMASAVGSAGQDISRAMSAAMTQGDRDVSQGMAQNLLLERGELQNELLRAQIARLRQAQVGPGAPSPSIDPWKAGVPLNDANDASRVTNDPVKINPGSAVEPGSGPGAHSDVDWVRTRDGGLTAAPSKSMKDRVEDMGFEPQLWTWRNRVIPYLTGMKPPPTPSPTGEWRFNHWNQTWYPAEIGPNRSRTGIRMLPY